MTVEVVSKGAGTRRPFFRRRKSCPFSGPNAIKIDWTPPGLAAMTVYAITFPTTVTDAFGEAPARKQDHFLECFPVVFGVRVGKAECDIGVSLAENMRHAPIVADDSRIVRGGGRHRLLRVKKPR